jgi:DNA polymerase-3 subunit epsilon
MDICFIDFETTGIDPIRDKAIEVGALVINEDFQIIKKFHSFIRPTGNYRMRNSAKNTHHITTEQIENSPSEKEVLNNIFDALGTNYRFSAWNIGFDITFMRKLCNRNGFMKQLNAVHYRHIDVQSISFLAGEMKLLPQDTKSLSQLADYFNLQRNVVHSAFEDVVLLSMVYQNLIKLFKENITLKDLP